jgi:hypothetical protein
MPAQEPVASIISDVEQGALFQPLRFQQRPAALNSFEALLSSALIA